MLKKAYLEITNACNLACSFCHGTKRDIKYLSEEEFRLAAEKLRPHTEYLYFHLMGEPLLHPLLGRFLAFAGELGFKVILTTNGTLLGRREDILLSSPALHKISISLHAYEANEMGMAMEDYLSLCFDFCKRASRAGVICVMRLWNLGGADKKNEAILSLMKAAFPEEWKEVRSGYRLGERVYLEWGEKFDWPDIEAPVAGEGHSCYGLRDQVGVLCDGTVVPCCLDAEGAVALGNIFEDSLSDILASPRAVSLKRSLEEGRPCEELCRRCAFAAVRFPKK